MLQFSPLSLRTEGNVVGSAPQGQESLCPRVLRTFRLDELDATDVLPKAGSASLKLPSKRQRCRRIFSRVMPGQSSPRKGDAGSPSLLGRLQIGLLPQP